MFGSARGVYQVYAWSSWVQDSVGSPLLAHYLVSFQPMEANSLQSYYLSIFMRIKGTGPCGWMKEWMNECFFLTNMMKQIKFFLDVLGLKSFFVDCCSQNRWVSTRSAEILLNSGRTLRHPLHASIWRTAFSVCRILNLSLPNNYWNYIEIIQNHWVSDDVENFKDPEYRFYTSANSYCPFGP